MGRASREKGKRGEREARDMVRSLWRSSECSRAAQVSGKLSADVVGGPPGLHIEVKRYAAIGATRWLEQATRDGDGLLPVVLCREDHGEWMVLLPMSRSVEFATLLHEHMEQQEGGVSDMRGEPRACDE